MRHPLVEVTHDVVAHGPKPVKGGQFKGGYDLHADAGSPVYAPVAGKIAHVYRNKTQCQGPPPKGVKYLPGFQFTISEEFVVRGDRHLTGLRFFLARLETVDRLSFPPLRHVEEGQLLGHLIDFLHISSNRPLVLAQLLGV